VLVPSPVLALAFVALDELDKATGALLRAALRLLQGDAVVEAEGQPVDVAPAAYATSNAGLGVLPESYRRHTGTPLSPLPRPGPARMPPQPAFPAALTPRTPPPRGRRGLLAGAFMRRLRARVISVSGLT
jgi:hypothetical protein